MRGIRGVSALLALVLVAGAACTGGTDDRTEVDADGDLTADREQLATANGFASSTMSVQDLSAEGLGLDVEYFEALRKGDWEAPEHCWFSTRVSVADRRSPGFDGPRSDDDVEAGDGVLVGSLPVVEFDGAESTTGVATSSDATTVPSADGAPTTSVPAPTVSGVPPPPIVGAHAEEFLSDAGAHGLQVLLVAVYGHDQVAELRLDHPDAAEGRTLDSRPVDGWTLLTVALDAGPELPDEVGVRLRRIAADGAETVEDLVVPIGGTDLVLLTDRWRFDTSAVDASCSVPGGDVSNEAAGPQSDLLGSPIGDAPDLPPPGEQPADPAGATDEVLRSLRAVYDLSDVYAASKSEYVENPDDWLVMRQQLMANDVVAPYMSNLDPQFRNAVFTSPTEARVLYRVGPTYQWEIGRVLQIDGRWRVAAGTVCRDLSAAGYRCPNTVDDAPPGPLGG